jgi:hypothetical protein
MIKEIVISRSLLAHQYETMKVTEIMDYYGVCCARLYKLLDEAEIPRKWDKAPKREYMKTVFKD